MTAVRATLNVRRSFVLAHSARLLLGLRLGPGFTPDHQSRGWWMGGFAGLRGNSWVHVLFLQIGASSDLPLRPWPAILREIRGEHMGSRVTWLAWCGLCIGWQRLVSA